MNGYMKEVVNDRKTTINHNFVAGHEYEFVVRAVGPDGTEEAIEHAVRDVVNIVGEQFPPNIPEVLTATGFLLSITLAWVNPTNYDMDKMEIWRGVSDEVLGAVKIAEVRGTSYVDSIGEAGITRYYWIKAVDTSGNVSDFYPLTSTGVSATTVGVAATNIDDFAITATKMFNKTIILNADSWTNDSPGAGSVAWNAHSVVYNGVAYPIAAGNTASAYIYWIIGNTTYSSGASHPTLGTTAFMVAINTGGTHTLVWNSSANMVIGTAFIANLAVTNAKINDLSASKLTAGTIDASVITVTNINASNITTGTLLARTIRTATSGARFDIMYPDIGTIRAIDDVGGVVFEIYIAGADVGDVTIGDFTGDKGCRWDKSAGTFTVRGILNADDLVAGTIDASVITVTNLNATNITTGILTGRRVQTAAAGQRIVLDVSDNTLKMYNSSDALVVTFDDDAVHGSSPALIMTGPSGGFIYLRNSSDSRETEINQNGIFVRSAETATQSVEVNSSYIDIKSATGLTPETLLRGWKDGGRVFEFDFDGNLDTDGYVAVADKVKMTLIGGLAIKLTNKTGSNTVAGQLVRLDTATDDGVILAAADGFLPMGVFLDSGVANNAEAWVVVSGIADVAMEDNTSATHGNWVRGSVTEAGYSDATNAFPPGGGLPQLDAHSKETGHCLESVAATGGGTHILARCILHYN